MQNLVAKRREETMSVAAIFLSLCFSASSVSSFNFVTPTFTRHHSSSSLNIGNDPNVVLGGNTWNPDEGKMRPTDTGDFFPEGYEQDVEYTDGMQGSQGMYQNKDGPELPGMENLGADAVMMGGIDEATDIPPGMEFVPSSVPDGEVQMRCAASGNAVVTKLNVAPVCMTFEDFYAAFSPDSHPSFSVKPNTGRMDRRGGEVSEFEISCDPRGQAGTFVGNLVINLPEDNSKICYKVTAEVF